MIVSNDNRYVKNVAVAPELNRHLDAPGGASELNRHLDAPGGASERISGFEHESGRVR
jgi:hypothetical protein